MEPHIFHIYSPQAKHLHAFDIKSANSTKRKLEENSEQASTTKRVHLLNINNNNIDSTQTSPRLFTITNQLASQQMEIPPEEFNITLTAIYASSDRKPASFQLSKSATVNKGNYLATLNNTTGDEDTVMVEDDLTDEDELLQTPSHASTFNRYITADIGEDVEDDSYIGSLERGWSDMFNEMI